MRVPSLLTVPANALGRGRVGACRCWEETTNIGKAGCGMCGLSPRGAECVTFSRRTTLRSSATSWVASLPSAPGLPGSPHSPEL